MDSTENVKWRCQFDAVMEKGPATCDPKYACQHSRERFVIINDIGKLILKSCEWAATESTDLRCQNDIIFEKCPASVSLSDYCCGVFNLPEVKVNLSQ